MFDALNPNNGQVHLPTRGHDHASLALLPLGVFGDDRRSKPLTVTYQADVDGRLRRVNVTLNPGPGGLPTPTDQTTFLGILQLYMKQSEQGATFTFRINELLDTLDLAHGGGNRMRIRESLDRLGHLAINVHSSFVARNGQEYTVVEKMAHLIDTYEMERRGELTCYIRWGDIVLEAFQLGDLKRLDWELVKTLADPIASQLYRLLDRVLLAGESRWEIGWRPLAQALGMGLGYDRPAKFKDQLAPHIKALQDHEVIEGWEYVRGGRFIFQLRNYTRCMLRQVLGQLGVFPEAARQLVAAHDEPDIMVQCDCLQHGSHSRPDRPGGFLTEAIRNAYELRYATDEPERFLGIWDMLGDEEQQLFHRAALWLCDLGDDLFATRPDATAWPQRLRSVVRFLVCHSFDPEEVLRPEAQPPAIPAAETDHQRAARS